MLYRQIVGFSCLLKRQQSQQANWTHGGWKQTISVSDQDEEMLILPGHLCSWANSLWKSCGHTLLSWWRSGRRYLGPATSVGLCIRGGTLQRPYASGMQGFWFHQLFHEQFVLLGLVKHSWAERLPSLGGGGGAEWTVAWLCKPTPQSLSRPALPHVLEDTLAVPGKHGGKKCVLCRVLPGGGTTADGPSRGTLHAFHSSLPMHCHYITFHCLWGSQGQARLLLDRVTGHKWMWPQHLFALTCRWPSPPCWSSRAILSKPIILSKEDQHPKITLSSPAGPWFSSGGYKKEGMQCSSRCSLHSLYMP